MGVQNDLDWNQHIFGGFADPTCWFQISTATKGILES